MKTQECNKVPYSSQKDAKRHLGNIRKIGQSHKKPVRTYECDLCSFWHLTSQPLEKFRNCI